MSRSVRWRSSASCAPPVRSGSRWSSRRRRACGVSVRTRGAASSIASGRPSSRRQIAATASAFSSVSRSRSRPPARARRRAATDLAPASQLRHAVGALLGCRRSGVRLVTSSFTPGASASRLATAGAAASTCSKLSSTSSSRLSRRYSVSVSSALSPGCSRRPSVCAIAGSTSSGSRTGASETKAAPSAKLVDQAGRDLQREPRLAGPAGADQRQQPHVVAARAARRPRPARAPARRRRSAPRAGS